ncbi:hypothetical protein E2562_023725 [Oryza meyeriana var. granulata]|uniref:Uncharacterized protein n=1 Tax=Oryza meyeriana var. granulata TaxID=110450 RepID=A0A6G1DLB4_9ORYZ|nr:hypothetical protein E2562_023725 [Oryza meyeriana var. granulata]
MAEGGGVVDVVVEDGEAGGRPGKDSGGGTGRESDGSNNNNGSMWEIEEALSWALRRLASRRSFVYLVHVFPVVISIPTAWPSQQVRQRALKILGPALLIVPAHHLPLDLYFRCRLAAGACRLPATATPLVAAE